jgi:hypothetical protein
VFSLIMFGKTHVLREGVCVLVEMGLFFMIGLYDVLPPFFCDVCLMRICVVCLLCFSCVVGGFAWGLRCRYTPMPDLDGG